MRVAPSPLFIAALAACSNTGSDAHPGAVRDSAGIAIVEYTIEDWERAPVWHLTSVPMAVIGGMANDGLVDLTNSQTGTLTNDGRVLAVTIPPPQIHVFSADGQTSSMLGRSGEGPGEYRFLSLLFPLGGDSVVGYDLMKARAVLFDVDGEAYEPIQFPLGSGRPFLMGRLGDGTWVFQSLNLMAQPPEGTSGVYRLDTPVLTWRAGAEAFDTAFSLPGPMLERGSLSMGNQEMTLGRNIGFGANSFVGGSDDRIWSTTGDRFVITGHTATGTLTNEVRVAFPPRMVTEVDRERYRTVLREELRRLLSSAPPAMLEAELATIEETPFADNRPAIAQMLIDRLGRIWVTQDLPLVDTTAVWGVFDADGTLLGKVVIPSGTLYAANEDRIVVRREEQESGLARLEVWGLDR